MPDTNAMQHRKPAPPQLLKWEEISEPGAYVEVETGTLYRVPREALRKGALPGVASKDARALRYMQLSKNPFLFPLGARLACVRHNIRPNF